MRKKLAELRKRRLGILSKQEASSNNFAFLKAYDEQVVRPAALAERHFAVVESFKPLTRDIQSVKARGEVFSPGQCLRMTEMTVLCLWTLPSSVLPSDGATGR